MGEDAAWQAAGLKQTGAEQQKMKNGELLMWGISEEQEVMEAMHSVPAKTILMRDSSMPRMPRANSVSFFSLRIPDPAHRKARKETRPGSLKEILTEIDASSDPVSHHSPPLCSFPSAVAAEHLWVC